MRAFLFEEKERLSGDKFLMLNPTSSAVKKVVQKFRVFPTQIFTSTRVWYTLFWRTSTICLWGTGLTAYSRHSPSLKQSHLFQTDELPNSSYWGIIRLSSSWNESRFNRVYFSVVTFLRVIVNLERGRDLKWSEEGTVTRNFKKILGLDVDRVS